MGLPVTFWIRAHRWAWILNQEGRSFQVWDLFWLTFVGVALSLVVPASLGEIGRFYFGGRAFGHHEEMLSSSIADKIYGLFSVFILGAGAAFLFSFPRYGFFSLGIACLMGTFLMVPHLFPWEVIGRFGAWVMKRPLDGVRMRQAFTLPLKRQLVVVSLSLISWLGSYFLFFLICLAFQSDISFFYLLAVAPLITVARLFPLTLSGLGSQEAVVVYLFHQAGVSSETALIVSLVSQLILTVIPGLFGICLMFLFQRQTVPIKMKEMSFEKEVP